MKEKTYKVTNVLDLESKRVVERYSENLKAINITRQVIPLVNALQKHRGTTLASMDGDLSFRQESKIITQEIDKRLKSNAFFNALEIGTSLPKEIYEDWELIRSWQGKPMQSFSIHSKMIERLMDSLNVFVKPLSDFMELNRPKTENLQESKSHILVQTILVDVPIMIESLAQLRGLSTHIMVIKTCNEEDKAQIENLIRDLTYRKERFRQISSLIQQFGHQQIPTLIELQVQDFKLVQLIEYIKLQILNEAFHEADSHYIFNAATTIIEKKVEILNEGMEFMQGSIHRAFDQWHTRALPG